MNILDSIYIRLYRWYDHDGIGMKKENAPRSSALFLGMILSLWLQFLIIATLKLLSISPFSLPKYFYLLVWILVVGLCYRYYFYNERGFAIYHSDAGEKVRAISRAKIAIVMLAVSFLPFALMILVALL